MKRISTVALAAALGASTGALPVLAQGQQATAPSSAGERPAQPERLQIGDPAPEIHVAEWVKGEPIRRLETGNVYVVEFWATWCVPCRDSIPHLTKLQEQYKDDDVHIVGVSAEDAGLQAIEPYVENMGEQMDYRVAYDDERRTYNAYFRASGQSGIPTAFIVDRDKRVAWIGHPLAMDDVLGQVVKGEYDVDAARRAVIREAELMRKAQPLLTRLDQAVQAGDMDQAADIAGEVAALDYEIFYEAAAWRYLRLVELGREKEAKGYLSDLITNHLAEAPEPLHLIAWTIATSDPAGRDLDLALKAAKQANTVAEGKNADVLDTLARVHYERGELELAIATQQKAIDVADGAMKEHLQRTLDQYRRELEQQGQD